MRSRLSAPPSRKLARQPRRVFDVPPVKLPIEPRQHAALAKHDLLLRRQRAVQAEIFLFENLIQMERRSRVGRHGSLREEG